MKNVLIIGGGFAGLSAGVALADKGVKVSLLENRKILGGRAYSMEDGNLGELIDNGQHALLGSFRETQKFLKTIGTAKNVRFQKRFEMVLLKPDGKRVEISSSLLPAPFHMAGALLFNPTFDWSERLKLLQTGASLIFKRRLPENWTVKDWLEETKQPESLRQNWWNPLLTSALNEQPHRASADLFLNLAKKTFLSRKRNASFGFFNVNLNELYTEQSRQFIETRGGEVFLDTPASKILISEEGVDGVVLRNGGVITADSYISAVPHSQLRRLLPDEVTGNGKPFGYLPALRDSPIISVQLWFDRPIMKEELLGFIGSPVQWVFNKSILWTEGETQAGALACHIGGARGLIHRRKEALVEMTVKELSRFLPAVRGARLVHARVVKERHATLSSTPENQRLRPEQPTSLSNFFLAGDWTRTGWPAMIESAVISGRRCAELILKSS